MGLHPKFERSHSLNQVRYDNGNWRMSVVVYCSKLTGIHWSPWWVVSFQHLVHGWLDLRLDLESLTWLSLHEHKGPDSSPNIWREKWCKASKGPHKQSLEACVTAKLLYSLRRHSSEGRLLSSRKLGSPPSSSKNSQYYIKIFHV